MRAAEISGVIEGRDLLLLASRLFATEIDVPLYRALNVVDHDEASATAPRLIDDRIRSLPEEESVLELAVEFCRLFVGPRPACPPYESVQRGEALIGGRADRRIKEFMDRHGLGAVLPAELPVLSYDHLAVEFALLHRLCDIAAGAAPPAEQRALEAAGELLELHLLPWAPAYLHDLCAVSRLAPYRTVAGLTARLLPTGRAGNEVGSRSTRQRKKGYTP